LRSSCETGAHFRAVLENRRKVGEHFLNLLDLRGLTVAQHVATGEHLWFLIGIQADVSHTRAEDMPDDNMHAFNTIAWDIRKRLTDCLASMAISGAMAASRAEMLRITMTLTDHEGSGTGTWHLLPTPKWRPSGKKAIYTPSGRRLNTMETLVVLETLTSLPNISLADSAGSPRSTPESSRASSMAPARKATDDEATCPSCPTARVAETREAPIVKATDDEGTSTSCPTATFANTLEASACKATDDEATSPLSPTSKIADTLEATDDEVTSRSRLTSNGSHP
jgi:hypothetical protein